MAAPLITRTPIINDDGSNSTGTVFEDAWKQELYNQIDAALASTVAVAGPLTILTGSAAGNDVVIPGRTSNTLLVWNGAASNSLTGIAGGVLGDRLTILHQGGAAAVLSLWHNAGSAAGNQLINLATSATTPVAYGGSATYVYTGAAWSLVAHEQGVPITAPFSAANFGTSSGTWTVAAGNVSTLTYLLRGRTVWINFYILNTTVSGNPVFLTISAAALGGFTPRAGNQQGLYQVASGGPFVGALTFSGATLLLYRDFIATAWAAGSTALYGNFQFEIQ